MKICFVIGLLWGIAGCGNSPGAFESDPDTATSTDEPDTNRDSSSEGVDTDTGTYIVVDGGPDTDTDSDTGNEDSLCEVARLSDPSIVCCPSTTPSSCNPVDWEFSQHGGAYGCCAPNLKSAVTCPELTAQKCVYQCGVASQDGPVQCVIGKNNSCSVPYYIDAPQTVSGDFTRFENTRGGGENCGNGDGEEDVWFRVLVPAKSRVQVTKGSSTSAVIRLVESCQAIPCLASGSSILLDNPRNNDAFVYIVLSQTLELPNFTISFTIVP